MLKKTAVPTIKLNSLEKLDFIPSTSDNLCCVADQVYQKIEDEHYHCGVVDGKKDEIKTDTRQVSCPHILLTLISAIALQFLKEVC